MKLIAAAAMLCDHTAMIFLSGTQYYAPMRALGRIAFPIFAFFIAQGCKYTHDKAKYVLLMLLVGVPCQAIEYLAASEAKLNIMFTLALGAAAIFAFECMKALWSGDTQSKFKGMLIFSAIVALSALISRYPGCQYGFIGVILPLCAYAPRRESVRLLCFTAALCVLSMTSATLQWFSLAALPFLMLYNGERGKMKLKYFFYAFYPLHLAALWGIFYLTRAVR